MEPFDLTTCPTGPLPDSEEIALALLVIELAKLKPTPMPDLRRAEALAGTALPWGKKLEEIIEFNLRFDPRRGQASNRLRWGWFWAIQIIFGASSLPVLRALHPDARRLDPEDLHIVRCGAPWTVDENNLERLVEFAAVTTQALYGDGPWLPELIRLMRGFAGRNLVGMRRRVAEEAGTAWGLEGWFQDLGGGWLFYSRSSAIRLIQDCHNCGENHKNIAKRDRIAADWACNYHPLEMGAHRAWRSSNRVGSVGQGAAARRAPDRRRAHSVHAGRRATTVRRFP
jgi:hypothetical protein